MVSGTQHMYSMRVEFRQATIRDQEVRLEQRYIWPSPLTVTLTLVTSP